MKASIWTVLCLLPDEPEPASAVLAQGQMCVCVGVYVCVCVWHSRVFSTRSLSLKSTLSSQEGKTSLAVNFHKECLKWNILEE